MRTLIVFNHVSLDGYFVSAGGQMNWAHAGSEDAEYNQFVREKASGGGELLFGRVTYEMMASYWPTPLARQQNGSVADGMNRMAKVVFSRTLATADWQNTRLLKGDLEHEVRRLKHEDGPGMVILGSGSIVAQLAPKRLIDEYQVVVNPVVLGAGRTMFAGLSEGLSLELASTRAFANGKVYLCYRT